MSKCGEDSGAIINAADLNSEGNLTLIGNSVINRGNISAADINLVGVGSGDVLVELANSGEVISLSSAVSSDGETFAQQNQKKNVGGEVKQSDTLDGQSSLLMPEMSSVKAENVSSLPKSDALRGKTISLSSSKLLSLGLKVNKLGELVLSDSGLPIEAGDVVIYPVTQNLIIVARRRRSES